MLARYSGWGGISDAFDESRDNWHREYVELKTLLSQSEYKAARASTRTAFYTDPYIINSIYEGLERFGFKGGYILEIILAYLIQRAGIIKKCAFAV